MTNMVKNINVYEPSSVSYGVENENHNIGRLPPYSTTSTGCGQQGFVSPTAPSGVEQCGDNNGTGMMGTTADQRQRSVQQKSAVVVGRQQLMKVMNIELLERLIRMQGVAAAVIFLSQIILYCLADDLEPHAPLNVIGIGIWGPIVFFFTAAWMAWMTAKRTTGCRIGVAMTFQILSIIVGILLLLIAALSLISSANSFSYKRDSYRDKDYVKVKVQRRNEFVPSSYRGRGTGQIFGHSGESDDWIHVQIRNEPEPNFGIQVAGRLLCSLMIMCAACIVVTSFVISSKFCRVTCCANVDLRETRESSEFNNVEMQE